MSSHWVYRAAFLGALCALVACGRGAPASTDARTPRSTSAEQKAPGRATWTDHGATACDEYLTSAFVAGVLAHPTGKSKKLSPQSCTYQTTDNYGSISITLTGGGPAAFDQHQQFLADPVPLSGVGDKASRSIIGIEAVKGNDRTCAIDTVGPPGSLKLSGEPLARQLGTICNKLFALP